MYSEYVFVAATCSYLPGDNIGNFTSCFTDSGSNNALIAGISFAMYLAHGNFSVHLNFKDCGI